MYGEITLFYRVTVKGVQFPITFLLPTSLPVMAIKLNTIYICILLLGLCNDCIISIHVCCYLHTYVCVQHMVIITGGCSFKERAIDCCPSHFGNKSEEQLVNPYLTYCCCNICVNILRICVLY